MADQTELIVRPLQDDDVPAVIELFRRTWLGELPLEEGTLAATLVLCEYLSDHAWGRVVECPRGLLGVVLAGLRQTDQSGRWASLREDALAAAQETDPSLSTRLTADVATEVEEARVTRTFKASGLPQADATIQLLLLAPEARGRHLGARLLDAARTWMRSEGARGYFLMTDDDCDVSFYDHMGLERMSAQPVETDGGSINIYVYGESL